MMVVIGVDPKRMKGYEFPAIILEQQDSLIFSYANRPTAIRWLNNLDLPETNNRDEIANGS
jgi:hypothetical protein